MVSPAIAIAALLTLAPFLATAFFAHRLAGAVDRLAALVRVLGSAILCVPYLLIACSTASFRWCWLAVYALLPIAVSALMDQARRIDPEQRGNWRDFLVLAALGLAVDLRWLEAAWPAHLSVFNKILLLDAGIYSLLIIRQLNGVGFDLRLRASACASLFSTLRSLLSSAWASAFCICTPHGRLCRSLAAHFSSPSSSSPFRKSSSFADGCRTCWNGAWGAPRRCF